MLQLGLLLLGLEAALLCLTDAFPIDVPASIHQRNSKLSARQNAATVPDFALQYAPIMYLHSDEQWFPIDVKTFLPNVLPYDANHLQLSSVPPNFTSLSTYTNDPTYLSSIQDITTLPNLSWLNNEIGRPDTNGNSTAPVEILVAGKEGGIIDVFYFFFFAYNKGPEVLGTSFGDHVGDWEHVMIRFQKSLPTAIYLSQHNSGTAYSWDAIIKNADGRPVVYIGEGDHACYAMPGTHTYDTILTDETNAGTIWNISFNYRGYSFNSISGQFSILTSSVPSSSSTPVTITAQTEDSIELQEGVNWVKLSWGDKKFNENDDRQFCAFGQCRYTDGPLGPYLKNLGRKTVCQDDDDCVINTTL